MWKVVLNKGSEVQTTITRDRFRAEDLESKAISRGHNAEVTEYFADVLVLDADGIFIIVQKRVDYRSAEEFQRRWNARERDSSCLVWPSETPFPDSWKLREDDSEDGSDSSIETKLVDNRSKTLSA
jgi:hypothetical protein